MGKDELVKLAEQYASECSGGEYDYFYEEHFVDFLKGKVKPLVKGSWSLESNQFKCSNCKKRSKEQTDFCPNCGAEMKKVEVITRDCHKCVYEVGCSLSPINCKKYKRDAPDGGYYG